ncbi:MAG: glycosyltransferase [Candidatus Aminicenantia bacterium]
MAKKEIAHLFYVEPLSAWWRGKLGYFPFISRDKLSIVRGRLIVPGERWRWIRGINRNLLAKQISRQIKRGSYEVVIFYHPWDLPLAQKVASGAKVIFDWTDNWARYYEFPEMNQEQELAVKSSDGVIAVTNILGNMAKQYRHDDNVLILHNATLFKPLSNDISIPQALQTIPRPRIGYIGHIGPWFDIDLLIRLVRIRPEWHWILVGSMREEIRVKLINYPNIHSINVQAIEDIPGWMAGCDVLAAPYRSGLEGDATKLYDYLTSGLPIVSSLIETSSRLQPWVSIARNEKEWVEKLQKAINEKEHSVRYARQQASLQHHWSHRAETLLEWLTSLL